MGKSPPKWDEVDDCVDLGSMYDSLVEEDQGWIVDDAYNPIGIPLVQSSFGNGIWRTIPRMYRFVSCRFVSCSWVFVFVFRVVSFPFRFLVSFRCFVSFRVVLFFVFVFRVVSFPFRFLVSFRLVSLLQ